MNFAFRLAVERSEVSEPKMIIVSSDNHPLIFEIGICAGEDADYIFRAFMMFLESDLQPGKRAGKRHRTGFAGAIDFLFEVLQRNAARIQPIFQNSSPHLCRDKTVAAAP